MWMDTEISKTVIMWQGHSAIFYNFVPTVAYFIWVPTWFFYEGYIQSQIH